MVVRSLTTGLAFNTSELSKFNLGKLGRSAASQDYIVEHKILFTLILKLAFNLLLYIYVFISTDPPTGRHKYITVGFLNWVKCEFYLKCCFNNFYRIFIASGIYQTRWQRIMIIVSLHVLIYLILIIISVKLNDLSRVIRLVHSIIRIGMPPCFLN